MDAASTEKLQARMRKLLALAERGEGGEKANARRMLDKLMERHGLFPDDLAGEVRELRWFPVAGNFERRLAIQIVSKVHDTPSPETYRSKAKPKQIGIELTPAEAIEFELHYAVLRKALADHFDDSFVAFVQANRIFAASGGGTSELTERDRKALAMAGVMEPTPVHRQLSTRRPKS